MIFRNHLSVTALFLYADDRFLHPVDFLFKVVHRLDSNKTGMAAPGFHETLIHRARFFLVLQPMGIRFLSIDAMPRDRL